MKTCFFFFFSILIIIPNKAQNIYLPPRGDIDSSKYEKFKGILFSSFNIDIKSNDFKLKSGAKTQIFNSYYHLNAPKDTVLKYLYNAVTFDPTLTCEYLYRQDFNFNSRTKGKYYPNEMKKIKCICDSVWNTLDSILIGVLNIVQSNDQKYREKESDAPWISGNEQKWVEQKILDSLNQMVIHSLLMTQGYLSKNKIGYDLIEVPYMVIQHADLKYQEAHLEIIRKAVKDDIIGKHLWAPFIDRILMRKNLPQQFGTQLIYNKKRDRLELYKIQDMNNINQLRADYFLGSIERYLKDNNAFLPDTN